MPISCADVSHVALIFVIAKNLRKNEETMMKADYILTFWGKARPQGCSVAQHPLLWHSLDVAACFEKALDFFPAPLHFLMECTKADEESVRLLLTRLACFHDIGKFSSGFQSKVPSLFPKILGALPAIAKYGDHTSIGLRLLSLDLFSEIIGLAPEIEEDAWQILLLSICAHHGRPLQQGTINAAESLSPTEIGAPVFDAARALIAFSDELFGSRPFAGSLSGKDAKKASWLIAGLVNLADWLGSNQKFFPYQPPGDMGAYWRDVARPQAKAALLEAGLKSARPAAVVGYKALTGSRFEPSPLQNYAETTEIGDGPQLFLIEDMTGAGKTEAALILAQRLMSAGHGQGLFVALPTMATANAIYDRLQHIYRRLFQSDAAPSLVLAHGASRLHQGFSASVLDIGDPCEAVTGRDGDSDQTASASCAHWIADDRRRALFAQVGAGTIDQAFLAVLPSKFAALRQLGLSRSILIVDEAHAYGAYEGAELQRLLTFHASHGGSAIILSATLPQIIKQNLTKAFRLGLQLKAPLLPNDPDYPAATRIDRGSPMFTALKPREDLVSIKPAVRADSPEEAIEALIAVAQAGACGAYIRNTVDDVLAAAAALREKGLNPLVFHARFAMCDRQIVEREVIRLFGPQSTPEIRAGRILVASQVAEQSLDFDVDFLASDLAPIDLLIQRAGRLWRHRRGARPWPAAQLMIVSPDPVDDADSEWFRRAFPKAGAVYANHALLWRSAKSLFDAGAIKSPENVRALVEQVYDAAALDEAPQGLERRRFAAEGKEAADEAVARMNLLDWKQGYCADAGAWTSDVLTPTRLGEERTVFRLALWDGEKLSPWSAPEDPENFVSLRRAWALSEINIRRTRAKGRGAYPPEIEKAATEIEKPWREFGDTAVILPLGSREDVYLGLLNDGRRDFDVRYDKNHGLSWGNQQS